MGDCAECAQCCGPACCNECGEGCFFLLTCCGVFATAGPAVEIADQQARAANQQKKGSETQARLLPLAAVPIMIEAQ